MLPTSKVSTTLEEYSDRFMSELLQRAKQYCHHKQIRLILEPVLGSGTDGYLDNPPDYFKDPNIMTTWITECGELFESDWPKIQRLLYALQKFGIYYVDPKPANIRTKFDA